MATFKTSNRSKYIASVLLWIVVLVFALIWIIPFVFMVFTSLKTQPEIFSTPAFEPPPTFAWENYSDAIERGDLWTSTSNTLTISVIKVPLGFFVLGMMVPIQVTLAPLFHVIINLGLLNTKLGIILPYIAFGNPYQIFMLFGFFSAIPKEIDESA